MKKLLIIRHAKSSWKYPELSDYDRPLNARGKRDGPLMAQRLQRRYLSVDLLISSPSLRTRQTAEALHLVMGIPWEKIAWESTLYHGNTAAYWNTLRTLGPAIDTACLIGHNPGITDFANQLHQPFTDNIPTLGMACFQFPTTHWQEAAPHAAELLWYDYPKRPSE